MMEKLLKPINHQPNTTVNNVIKVARYIEANADQHLTLSHLAEVFDTAPAQLRREFIGVFGISPKRFHSGIRQGLFKHALKNGNTVTDSAFSSGFNSLSRVHGDTPHYLGMAPEQYRKGGKQQQISYSFSCNSFGLMIMAATDTGICCVEFGDSKEQLLSKLQNEFPLANITESTNAQQLKDWQEAIAKYLQNNAPLPHIPFDLQGTALQIQVWQFLTTIPKGETLSYQSLARKLGKPNAVRAIASACGKNRIAILIPCHRVLRSDGSLGGYRWGLERKQQLLDAERPDSTK